MEALVRATPRASLSRGTKGLALALSIVLLLCVATCRASDQSKTEDGAPLHHLVVLHTNDTHGHPVKFYKFPMPDVGGLPARATLVRRIRETHKHVLVLDAGDLNTGRPESNLFKAKPDILGYNYIGYDAMALGNHEFDHPLPVLKEQMKWANFPFLSANVKTKAGRYLTEPFLIKSFNGLKVAIFGLTTKRTEIIGNPDHIKGLVFEDEVEVARKLVPELRKTADLVVGLVHMGIYGSSKEGSKRLASEVSGIDLIVDGNTNTRLDHPLVIRHPESGHQTLIVQAWYWGLVLGRVDLWVRKQRVIKFKFRSIPINLKQVKKQPDGTTAYQYLGEPIKEDHDLLKILEPYVDQVESRLSEVIGYAEETFSSSNVRSKETALGNLVADAMLWYTRRLGTDFAIQNGGAIRTDLPKGPIPKKLIYEILPFDSTVVVLTIKGTDLQTLFNHIAGISPGQGAFCQVSQGLRFAIDRKKGQCEDIRIKGGGLDPNKMYRVATNSYLADGGDGYHMFRNAKDRYDTSKFQRDVLIEYIKHLGGRIRPGRKGRIKVLGSDVIGR
jgi:5'-nucleotidase/UDP-sugar diphosphatase